jgi:hypothetical protein
MNTSKQNQFADEALSQAEETLRMIARISAPEGLEERVQAGLRKAKSTASRSVRILAWLTALQQDDFWLQSNLARTAVAAAIVCLVVGGGWGVSARFQPAQPSSAIALPLHSAVQGGFSSAGAMRRTPQTLHGPIVEAPIVAHPAAAALQPAVPAAKAAMKTPWHRGHSASANKAAAQPAASAAK